MRNRWLISLVIWCLIAAGVGYLVTDLASGDSSRPQHWAVTSIAVPGGFNRLSTDGSHLFLGDGQLAGTCQLANVNLKSLQFVTSSVRCSEIPEDERFAVQYGRAGPLKAFWGCGPESAAVRLVSVEPGTTKLVVGRVIMRVSGTCSHDYPLTTYADGSMWVYDSSAGRTGQTGQIVELSATTGALETSATVPGMPAAVFAANADGFYIGPGEFYQRGQGIYHVAPGSSHAQFLRSVPGPMAWMFGVGQSMYAALQHDYSEPCADDDCQLWRFEGPNANPTLLNSDLVPGDESLVNAPVGTSTVGILTTRAQPADYPTSFEVVLINPSSGTAQVVARLAASTSVYVESSAYVSGAFFALVEGRLFRVAP